MKYLFNVSCSILLSVLFFACNAQTNTALTADEFQKNITTADIQLLDVRTPAEYNSGHIKNSLQADWNDKKEFNRRIEFIDKSKPVYVYCLAGGRSAAAGKEMRAMGYENVYELTGGINAWKAASLPLEGKINEKQMSIEEFNTAIKTPGTVLVDFGAEWCPPCKKMEPVLKNLQANNMGKFTLVKVDGGKDDDILKQYSVTQLPVFIIFKDGKQVWRRDGIATEKEIADAL
jgi:rhodanese-related sulfurtransferase